MFQPNQFLKESCDNKNVEYVRGALIAIMQADPTTKTNKLENSIRYAEDCGISVFEEETDPDLLINSNSCEWDSRYYARTLAYLNNNFTKERLLHAIEVGRAIHSETPTPVRSVGEETGNTYATPRATTPNTARTNKKQEQCPSWSATALITGGAIAALLLYLLFKK